MRIGLTGGIGSGKSTVAACLVRLGATLVDTDAIAHRLTAAGGRALTPIVQAFGENAVAADGAMDRAFMRETVFTDARARLKLEAILHPMIGEDVEQAAQLALGRPVVFDVPLLAESGRWRTRVDRVLVVDCRHATQIERVMRRSGWDAQAVQRVLDLQATRRARRAIADAVIFNDGLSQEQVAYEVSTLWNLWTARPL